MSRAEGERTRIRHAAERLRATLVNLDTALRLRGPLGADNAEALQQTAAEIARHVAAHDAYVWAEYDQAGLAVPHKSKPEGEST